MGNFDKEVDFMPVALVDPEFLKDAEDLIMKVLRSNFQKVGWAREWFETTDRLRISEIIASTLVENGIKHEKLHRKGDRHHSEMEPVPTKKGT